MSPHPFSTILQSIGLNEGESLIYVLLLQVGTATGRDLTEQSGIGRGNVYSTLTSLQKRGLVIETKGKKATYQPVEPHALRRLLSARDEQMRALKASFEVALHDMESQYRLASGRPAVQVFEGWEGVEQALADSLESKTEILTYFDPSAMTGEIVKINRLYVKRRVAKKIQKRIIAPDTPEARHIIQTQGTTSYTSVAFVSQFPQGYATGMEIYDGAISYLTLKGEHRISIIIRDQAIYDLHRRQFDYVWGLGSKTAMRDRPSGVSGK